ncbi:type 2 lanthipeptide synthetase LanM family protein [Clostridium folliculivorans]|uniref:Type 2 lantibiotic biosynthesis protein n=1 Tax=Clostridium folliculivorans TaxID=2886038 RepID=A0A9W5Y554_9CLOT|nr:type 2 lanthipeptide synthetase LanM family protein [Clostridium folliculivorans]GKU26678.1 type 2 lantibiotic biosynthesis protein [Clostridium folliculivorans]GKU28890.1 type 2 lantibiotic biosynthesis protein [Clostridium folliculivorans]
MEKSVDVLENKYFASMDSSELVDLICNNLSPAFGNLYRPFLIYCEKHIERSLEKFSLGYSVKVDKQTIISSLLASIAEEITALTIRTLIVELNCLKSNNKLKGESSIDRYNDFNEKLSDILYLREIFNHYPVLLYLIDTKISDRLQLIDELLERLGIDKQSIESKFSISIFNLTNINISSGDSHNDGKKVTILQFGERTIVYKPHGLSPESLFNKIISYLNKETSFQFYLKKLECIDCINYGWQEFAVYEEAENSDDIDRFYYRTGALLAIFYMFSCSDLHYENILACKDTPAIFDLETLVNIFQQSVEGGNTNAEINKEFACSVLGTMLLPANFINGSFDFDLSGMAGTDNTVSNKWFYFQLENAGTDEICLSKEPCASPKGNNALIYNNEVVSPKLNLISIQNGFSACYSTLENKCDEILDIIRKNRLVIRHVLRPTALYARFLEASTQPNYLESMESRKTLFSKMYINQSQGDIVKCEIEALLKHDVPYFSSEMNSKTIVGNLTENIQNYFQKSAYQIIEDKVKQFSKNDLDKQLYYISQSLNTLNEPIANYSYNLEVYGEDSYISSAKIIADQIYNLAVFNSIQSEASILMALESSNMRRIISPMDFNLYTGGGIILFLAALGQELKEQKYIGLAEQFLNYQLSNEEASKSLSAFTGTGSSIYICYNMYKITNNKAYYDRCYRMVTEINSVEDSVKDFVTGTAGLIVMLLNIFEKEQDKLYLEKAEWLGEQLYQSLQSENENLLTGLAHGLSGYAWALIKLGVMSSKKDYIEFGLDLIKKENSHYVPSEYNWKDLRGDGQFLSYWCYGGAGIALCRMKLLELINQENNMITNDLMNGIESIKNYKCKSSCICHGTFGNIDILLEIGKSKSMQKCISLAKDIANKELDNIQVNGITFGDNEYHSDFSFMQGLAGIGYTLVRLSNYNYPSILSLDVM